MIVKNKQPEDAVALKKTPAQRPIRQNSMRLRIFGTALLAGTLLFGCTKDYTEDGKKSGKLLLNDGSASVLLLSSEDVINPLDFTYIKLRIRITGPQSRDTTIHNGEYTYAALANVAQSFIFKPTDSSSYLVHLGLFKSYSPFAIGETHFSFEKLRIIAERSFPPEILDSTIQEAPITIFDDGKGGSVSLIKAYSTFTRDLVTMNITSNGTNRKIEMKCNSVEIMSINGNIYRIIVGHPELSFNPENFVVTIFRVE